ncbi:MAG: RNA-binding transcriptional accessory protein [Desulfobacterales bacterium]|nr:RNA-binding transcriptional accessory protein [Desulfobacterales bacterium]
MNQNHFKLIADELKISEAQVISVNNLLLEGSTVPFISRYRKEVTGSLDEVYITNIRDRITQLTELEDRKKAVLKSLEQNGHLNQDLEKRVLIAETMSDLEDIYLPYKPKRKTKGLMAKEKGLEPLALQILEQSGIDVEAVAEDFINEDKEVVSVEDALKGARDIVAEIINEDQLVRKNLRKLFRNSAVFQTSVVKDKEKEAVKYKDYYDWTEKITTAPSHRVLAMRRGEKEDLLNLNVQPSFDDAIEVIEAIYLKGQKSDSMEVKSAIFDCYKRLLSRSMETEIRVETKERADSEAIDVFSENLRQLLLSAPLGAKRILAIDPGFRTGCKVVCLDEQGQLKKNDTIYPGMSNNKDIEAQKKIIKLCDEYDIEAIAIGNGTASRETESFIRGLKLKNILITMVNESGASIYSASDIAREEFPDHDITVRGSVSIGRRLMDPLSELVKIDPKSIGVGQYQHDVDQNSLKNALDDVVISCVNGVGVDVNRSSVELLTYVSGLGKRLAKNIVKFRNENGPYISRKSLKEVPRLGPKAFEQAAGFLKITESDNILDRSSVHPESYHIVDDMAKDMNCSISDLINKKELRDKIDIKEYVTEKTGLPTLQDILDELSKPGRDPRSEFEEFKFDSSVEKISDLKEGMSLPGIVTNITAFGAFVDIGVHQDGLVHISEMSDTFVKDTSKVVKVHQKVKVRVLSIDQDRKRIALSMKTTFDQSKPIKKKSKKKITNNSSGRTPFNNPFAELLKK